MKRVIYATDFSDNSKHALPFLKAINSKEELDILLLHVFPDITGVYGPFVSQFAGMISAWEESKSKAEEMLGKWEDMIKSEGLKVSSKLSVGDPVSETIKEAENFKADFIVVGTRGISGFKGFLIGSFAKSLLHSSPIPVMTVRFPHKNLKRILVPVDLSSATEYLLKYLPKISSWGEITLYHVVLVDFLLDPKEKEEYVRMIEKEMPKYPGAISKVDIIYSPNLDYVGAITDFAEQNYDLILIASHGRSGISKVIFGSVAEGVISTSRVPVLTLNIKTLKL